MVSGDRESAIELLGREEMVLTYPGGARDSLKGRDQRYKLQWGERLGFAHVAVMGQSPVVPVVGIGPDDCFKVLGTDGLIPTRGLGSASLKLPLFLPILRRVAFDFHVGEPIQAPELDVDAARTYAASDEATGELARNMALARSLQFTGTPSWVAGDEIIQGLVPVERLAEAIAG